MSAANFDHDFVNESMERLGKLAHDAEPVWGKMTPKALPSHLAGLVLYSMGRNGVADDRSNWMRRNVLKRLLLLGVVRIPKNVRIPSSVAERFVTPKPYDVESLHALLEEYLGAILADEIAPPLHPVFGPFSVDDWARFHCLHFDHHFRQFGI